MTGTLLLQKRNTFRNLIMMVAYHLDLTTTKKKKKKSIWTSFIGCHLSFFVRKGFIVVSTQYIILLLLLVLEDNHTSCQIRGRSECDIWKVVGDLIDYIFMLQVTEKNILFQDHKVLQFF